MLQDHFSDNQVIVYKCVYPRRYEVPHTLILRSNPPSFPPILPLQASKPSSPVVTKGKAPLGLDLDACWSPGRVRFSFLRFHGLVKCVGRKSCFFLVTDDCSSLCGPASSGVRYARTRMWMGDGWEAAVTSMGTHLGA